MNRHLIILLPLVFASTAAFGAEDTNDPPVVIIDETIAVQEQEVEEEKPDSVSTVLGKIYLTGLVEVEASIGDYFGNEHESDIALSAAELEVGYTLTDWLRGYLYFAWDEISETFEVDEAVVTFGGTEAIPAYLTVGKQYVPFGRYKTRMVSSSLPDKLGEIRESAVLLGMEKAGFTGAAYVFNGVQDEAGDDDTVQCYGAAAAFNQETETMEVHAGLDYVNALMESWQLRDFYEDRQVENYTGAVAAHADIRRGPFIVIGEYVGAVEDPAFTDGEEKAPGAWNVELGYDLSVMNKTTRMGLAWQGTNHTPGFLPERRYLGTVSMDLTDSAALMLEYAHDEDYETEEGGSGDRANACTMLLSLGF
jgi:hypothetical protein